MQEMYIDGTTPNFTAEDQIAHGLIQESQAQGVKRSRWNVSLDRGDRWMKSEADSAGLITVKTEEEQDAEDVEQVAQKIKTEHPEVAGMKPEPPDVDNKQAKIAERLAKATDTNHFALFAEILKRKRKKERTRMHQQRIWKRQKYSRRNKKQSCSSAWL